MRTTVRACVAYTQIEERPQKNTQTTQTARTNQRVTNDFTQTKLRPPRPETEKQKQNLQSEASLCCLVAIAVANGTYGYQVG
jgi:hypothetical protein